ncbi:MAG: hypothetical protein U0894_16495 [Pirellulales bacterium]
MLQVSMAKQVQAQGELQIGYPVAMSADAEGNLFLADRNLPGIWKVTSQGPKVYWKGAKQLRMPGNAPRCIAIGPTGDVFLGDSATREVYRIGSDKAEPLPLTGGKVGVPIALQFWNEGKLVSADLELNRLVEVDLSQKEPAKSLREVASISAPRAMTITSEENLLVLTQGSDLVVSVGSDGSVKPWIAGQPLPKSSLPLGIASATSSEGKQVVRIADSYQHLIWELQPDAAPKQWISDPALAHPIALVQNGEMLWILDPRSKQSGDNKVFVWNGQEGLKPWATK